MGIEITGLPCQEVRQLRDFAWAVVGRSEEQFIQQLGHAITKRTSQLRQQFPPAAEALKHARPARLLISIVLSLTVGRTESQCQFRQANRFCKPVIEARCVRIVARAASNRSAAAKPTIGTSPASNGRSASVASSKGAASYSRNNPFSARLVSNNQHTHPESPKDTCHVVIDLLDSGLQYEPGDSLGILPQNDHDLVSAVINLLGKTGGETLTLANGKRTSLRHALTCEYTLTRSRPDLFNLLAQYVSAADKKAALEQIIAGEENPLASADLAEVLERFPSAGPPLDDLLRVLARLQPRLYSISSSQKAHPSEVHLTVGVVQFETLGR